MREQYIRRITGKGQVTIPLAVRQRLGLRPNDQVSFRIEEGAVKLEAIGSTLASVYGAVQPLARPEDFERISEIAQEDQALAALEKDE